MARGSAAPQAVSRNWVHSSTTSGRRKRGAKGKAMEGLRIVVCRLIRPASGNGVRPRNFFVNVNPDAGRRPYKLR
jgi:hypothetical protein